MLPDLLTPADPDTRPRIVELTPPTEAEVAGLLAEVTRRTTSLLRKRVRLDQGTDEEPEPQLRLVINAAPTCVSTVAITTALGAFTCGGTWRVQCDGVDVGIINTIGITCGALSASLSMCRTTFVPRPCLSIGLITEQDGDNTWSFVVGYGARLSRRCSSADDRSMSSW